MNPPALKIEVAAPCTRRWEDMAGDDRVRHCLHCSKNVYNLAGFTEQEALELVRNHEGRLCVRLFRRPDGTAVTRECLPVRVWRRTALAGGAVVLAVVTAFGLLLRGIADPASVRPHLLTVLAADAHRGALELCEKVKDLLGVPHPAPMIMGEMMAPPPSL